MKNIKERIEQPKSDTFSELVFNKDNANVSIKNGFYKFKLINGDIIVGNLNINGFDSAHAYIEKTNPKILKVTTVTIAGEIVPPLSLFITSILHITEIK